MKSIDSATISVQTYIAQFPPSTRKLLQQVRKAVREAAPDAEETISYNIPTFRYHGNLVHFAAWKDHIGFYPTSSGIKAFAEELAKYETSRGTVQFPMDRPLPIGLIKKLTRFRVKENRARALARRK